MKSNGSMSIEYSRYPPIDPELKSLLDTADLQERE